MSTRRLLLLTALLSTLLVMVACGGGGEGTNEPSTGLTEDVIDESEPTDEGAAEAEEAPAPESDEGADADVIGGDTEGDAVAQADLGRDTLTLWSHSAGNPNEIAVVEQMITDYNASQEAYEVVLESFPQESYNDSVAAASIAGSLPCIVDLDAPTVPNFAWSGYIQPLPVDPADIEALGILESDVGRWQEEVYSLGQFDVALLIYARESVLNEYGIRIPTLDEPWTLEEFNEALATLDASGAFEYAIDMNAAATGEWWPYAYSPLLQSFGGDLINRDTFLEAEGVLNGPEAVAWGEWFQGLFEQGYAPANPADDQGFNQGEVALWYTGSWAGQSVLDAWGDDALFLPPPDLGTGPKVGAGSWQFGVSSICDHPEGAAEFIMHTMQPENVALMSNNSSLIPTTEAGAAATEDYAEDGVFRVFYDMAERFAVIRPPTPAYQFISSQFEQAGLSIRDGGNVQDALDDAVDAIEQDIADNSGYGFE